MAFLDNSGDIILDAVLTDTGRMRLARGDGSFRIVKFALGDDEIDYGIYNKTHPSGSAYYDLEILQTPVLEAFTNNTSMLKSRLISISRTNLLYLPILKLNEGKNETSNKRNETANQANGMFVVAVDNDTEVNDPNTDTGALATYQGVLKGVAPDGGWIRIDQGLDTTEVSPELNLGADLIETQYIIEIDNRLGRIRSSKEGRAFADPSFIDDDNIATYYFSQATDAAFVSSNGNTDRDNSQAIAGPRGTILEFAIGASTELQTSTYLFTKLGSTSTSWDGESPDASGNTSAYGRIDSNVRVTGLTTGYRLDIPVRFIKKE